MNKTKSFYVIEVNNWNKYNYNDKTKDKSLSWLRLSSSLFGDHEFLTLSSGAKFVWLFICCQRAQSNPKPCRLSARHISAACHIKPQSVPKALSELTERQWIQILDAPSSRARAFRTDKEVERTSRTNGSSAEHEEKEKNLLQTQHEIGTMNSQTSQILPKKITTKPETKTAATWESFSNAYRKRYGSEPVRNATTNSQMSNFVKRIGEEESPHVAEFYVSLVDQFYLNQCHSVGILLRDSEKLRTMWANGIRNTKVDAKTAHWREQARLIETGEL